MSNNHSSLPPEMTSILVYIRVMCGFGFLFLFPCCYSCSCFDRGLCEVTRLQRIPDSYVKIAWTPIQRVRVITRMPEKNNGAVATAFLDPVTYLGEHAILYIYMYFFFLIFFFLLTKLPNLSHSGQVPKVKINI